MESMQRLVPLRNEVSNQRYGTYLSARQMLKSKGGLPRMAFCSKGVLDDYCDSGGALPFWLNEIVAHGSHRWSKGAELMGGLEDYSFGWKVPFSYLKDPSIIFGDAFAPGAVLIIAPKMLEIGRKKVIVHPQTIAVSIVESGKSLITVKLGGVTIRIMGSMVPCVRPARMELNGCVSLPRTRFSGTHVAYMQGADISPALAIGSNEGKPIVMP
jgi:hypothetical protein